MKFNSIVLAAAIIVTGTGTIVPAFASVDRVPVSRDVRFNDLDLASVDGRDQLDQRIRTAARRACGDMDARNLAQNADIRRCRHEALAFATKGRDVAVASYTRDKSAPQLSAADVPLVK